MAAVWAWILWIRHKHHIHNTLTINNKQVRAPIPALSLSNGINGTSRLLLLLKRRGNNLASWHIGIGLGKTDRIPYPGSAVIEVRSEVGTAKMHIQIPFLWSVLVIFSFLDDSRQSHRYPNRIVFVLREDTNSSPGSG